MRELVAEALRRQFELEEFSLDDKGVGQGQTSRFEITCGGRRFLAKLYGPQASRQQVEFETRLLSRLRRRSLSVARAVPTISDSSFAEVDGRFLLLYEWADGGIEWPAAPEQAKRLGQALARMHLAAKGMPGEAQVRRYDVERLVDRPMDLLEPFSGGCEADFERLNALVSHIRGAIASVPETDPCFGPIHGDIHQGNCHFNGAGEPTFFDFALCGIGYYCFDLTGFLWPMRDEWIDKPGIRECCEAFLDGYRLGRPLSREEERSLWAFVQVRTLWEAGDWIDTGTGRDQPEDVKKTIRRMVDQFEKAEQRLTQAH